MSSTLPEHLRREPRRVQVAAIQMSCDWNTEGNIAKAEALVRRAAADGAQLILLPELFETPYFCIEQDVRHLRLARPVGENRAVRHFSAVARELGVVLPISFFEHAGQMALLDFLQRQIDGLGTIGNVGSLLLGTRCLRDGRRQVIGRCRKR